MLDKEKREEEYKDEWVNKEVMEGKKNKIVEHEEWELQKKDRRNKVPKEEKMVKNERKNKLCKEGRLWIKKVTKEKRKKKEKEMIK